MLRLIFAMSVTVAMQAHSADIVRCKGTVAVHGHSCLFNFQGVHETLQLKKTDVLVADHANVRSEVVFIGRNLDQSAIQEGFATCVWRPMPPGWTQHTDPALQRRFYHHSASGRKSWTRPMEEDEATGGDGRGSGEHSRDGGGAQSQRRDLPGTKPAAAGAAPQQGGNGLADGGAPAALQGGSPRGARVGDSEAHSRDASQPDRPSPDKISPPAVGTQAPDNDDAAAAPRDADEQHHGEAAAGEPSLRLAAKAAREASQAAWKVPRGK